MKDGTIRYLENVYRRIKNAKSPEELDEIIFELQEFLRSKYISEKEQKYAIRLIEQAERKKMLMTSKTKKVLDAIGSWFGSQANNFKRDFHINHYSNFDWKSALIKFLIAFSFSWILFYIMFKNPFLLWGGILFSLSYLFPETGAWGGIHVILRGLSFFAAAYPFIVSFAFVNSIGKIFGILILFIGYLVLRTEYSGSSQYAGYEILSMWIRNIYSVLIAFQFFFIGKSAATLGGEIGTTLIGISLASYTLSILLDIPKVKKHEEGLIVIKEGGQKHENSWVLITSGIGYLTFLAAIVWIKGLMSISFFIAAPLLLFLTLSINNMEDRVSEGLPVFGVIFLISFLVFPTTIGESMLGSFIWSKIESVSPSSPFSQAFSSLKTAASDFWLMITCPQCYYQKMMEEQNPSVSKGVYYSVEVSDFKFYSSEDIIDPKYVFEGYFFLENKGDIPVDTLMVWLNPPEMKYKDEWIKLENVKGEITDCPGEKQNEKLCVVDKIIEKGEKYFYEFRFSDWDKQEVDGKTLDTTEEMDGYTSYVFGGKSVKINISYMFSYNTTTRLDMPVLSEEKFKEEVMSNTQEGRKVSYYQGGPIKGSISVYKNPIKEGDEFSVTFSIENLGDGIVENAIDTIYIPKEFELVEDLTKSLHRMNCIKEKESEITGYSKYTCTITEPLTDKEGKKKAYVIFRLKATLPSGADKKTYTFISKERFVYRRDIEKYAQIASFP